MSLRQEAPDAEEFAGLKRSGLARLADAQRPAVWRVLAKCHDARNLGEYEGELDIDERMLADLIAACQVVAAALEKLPSPA